MDAAMAGKTRPPRTGKPRARAIGGGNPKPKVGGLVKFKPGEGGRPKGVKNKVTVKLKEAILEAAELSGKDGKGRGGATGYLVWLSRAEPAVFGRMLEKLLPMQLDVKDTTDKVMSPEEAAQQLRDRGLPVPPSLASLLATDIGKAVMEQQAHDDDEQFDAERELEDADGIISPVEEQVDDTPAPPRFSNGEDDDDE